MNKLTIDEQILDALRENARISTAQLARQLRLSRTTVQSHIEQMERNGTINGYAVRVSEAYEGDLIRAHIMMVVQPRETLAVCRAMTAIREVRVVYSVSGAYDLLAVAATPTVGVMDALIDRIGAITGVERTTTSIILSTKFER